MVLRAITDRSRHFDELGEPAGVFDDALLGDQLSVAVNDDDIVLGFGPVDAAEHFHDFRTRRALRPAAGAGRHAKHGSQLL
jgi:hypothetical protein